MIQTLAGQKGYARIALAAVFAVASIGYGSAATAAAVAWTNEVQEVQQLHRRPNDVAVKRDVLRALAKVPSIDYRKLKVRVTRGIVTLRGTVPTRQLRARAERVAAAVPGVRLVINQLEIAGPAIRKIAD